MSVSPDFGESSSAMPPVPSEEEDRPLIVRVKRKASHSVVDAFWLEVNERPLKRPFLDFQNLSISDSSEKTNELRTKKVFVKHVETANSSATANELLQSLLPRYAEVSTSELKIVERRSTYKKEMMKEHLAKVREAKEVSTKNARFEQIWRSRNRNKVVNNDEGLHEMCNFYDVVRVDGEDKSKEEDMSVEDLRLLSSYLPLLRDVIPSAAAEIETDISSTTSKQGTQDDYMYDYYVVHDGPEISEAHVSTAYPLVQVDEVDEFYDGHDSDWESDDSNAENNPMFDYPEETSSEEEEVESDSDNEEKGEEDGSEESADMFDDASSSEEHVHRFNINYADDNDNMYDDDERGFGFEDGDESDN